jgi:hypothetical protein
MIETKAYEGDKTMYRVVVFYCASKQDGRWFQTSQKNAKNANDAHARVMSLSSVCSLQPKPNLFKTTTYT